MYLWYFVFSILLYPVHDARMVNREILIGPPIGVVLWIDIMLNSVHALSPLAIAVLCDYHQRGIT